MADSERAGGCLLPLLAVVWFGLLVVFGVALVAEHSAADCPVSPYAADSTSGVRRWQWFPPGSSCVLDVNLDVPLQLRPEWDQPPAWRGVLVILFAVSGLGLIYAFRRSEERYQAI